MTDTLIKAPTPDARPVRLPRRHLLGVGALALAMAAVHLTFALQGFYRLKYGSYDLVIFDQAIRSYSRFDLPVSIVKGVHNDFGLDFNILGDHFSPVLALLAPVYWVWDDPRALLGAQAVLFALTVPIVWVFTRRALGTKAAYLVAAAFTLVWPMQGATGAGFHEVAFAVPLIALMLERLQAGRAGQAVAAALGLLFVKEDMGMLVAAFGFLLLLRGRRRAGAALMALGPAAVYVTVNLVIPAFGGRADYYWAYDQLGPDVPSALAHMVTHPVDTLRILVTPSIKVHTMLWIFLAAGGLLCLGSATVLLTVPLLALRMFSSNENHWETTQHYNAFLEPILLFAAVETLVRLKRRWPWASLAWPSALLAATLVLVPIAPPLVTPFKAVYDPAKWHRLPWEAAAMEAARLVPDGALVEADDYVGPQLTTRARVLLLDCTPRGADWILATTPVKHFPFDSLDRMKQRLRLARAQGYQVVFQRDEVTLLKRTRPVPPTPPICTSW